MADKKTTLIQSSRGSVFSVFGEEELNQKKVKERLQCLVK